VEVEGDDGWVLRDDKSRTWTGRIVLPIVVTGVLFAKTRALAPMDSSPGSPRVPVSVTAE
jgi:hypothetical protein